MSRRFWDATLRADYPVAAREVLCHRYSRKDTRAERNHSALGSAHRLDATTVLTLERCAGYWEMQATADPALLPA